MLNGVVPKSSIAIEYTAETSYAVLVSVRKGEFKYERCKLDPEQLLDRENEPNEMNNLLGNQNTTKY